MNLSQALTFFSKNPEIPGFFLVTLRGIHSEMFLTCFFHRLKELIGDVTFLDVSSASLNEYQAQLEMSFLGMRKVYVLSQSSSLEGNSKKVWNEYLSQYKGPHCLLIFETKETRAKGTLKQTSESEKKSVTPSGHLTIELPHTITAQDYKELFLFFFPKSTFDLSFAQTLFRRQASFSLDDACRMMRYHLVVGRNGPVFFEQWFLKLVVPDTSLFSLSQALLGRSTAQFFRLWKLCRDDYPIEFWIAYWSEQLWQASQFIHKTRALGLSEAKKGYYRLPFKFLDTDWRHYTLERLSHAHNQLYELDFSLKNGGDAYGLELWYHRFLLQNRSL